MKKLVLPLLLGTICLHAMHLQDKADIRGSLNQMLPQLRNEARQQFPNFQALQADTQGLIMIRTTMDQQIPVDEQQKVRAQFNQAVHFYQKALTQAALADPAGVAQWLTTQLTQLDNDADTYEEMNALGKARIRNSLTVLSKAADAIAQNIVPGETNRQANLIQNIGNHVRGEILQQNI